MSVRKLRMLGALAAALLFVGLLGGLLANRSSRTYLDPDAATPGGARAVAQLLRDEGVVVQRVTDRERALSAAPGTTLVVASAELLSRDDLRRIQALPADVVIIGATAQTPQPFPGVRLTPAQAPVQSRTPECSLRAAQRAGTADTGGATYVTSVDATGCYPSGVGATVVQVSDGDRSITLLGSGAPLTNDRLADAGNAALALNLLGTQPSVLWWLPTPQLGGGQSLVSLLPPVIFMVAVQLVVVVLVLAAWRARRLGRVVGEPLPVLVRASETTEGRARLYQRTSALPAAAAHLRAASVERVAQRLAVPAGSPPAVVAAVSRRTGRAGDDVQRLLYGPVPGSDADLVALTRSLDALETEVRRA